MCHVHDTFANQLQNMMSHDKTGPVSLSLTSFMCHVCDMFAMQLQTNVSHQTSQCDPGLASLSRFHQASLRSAGRSDSTNTLYAAGADSDGASGWESEGKGSLSAESAASAWLADSA